MNEIEVVNDALIVWKGVEYEPVTPESGGNDVYALLDLNAESPELSAFQVEQRLEYDGRTWAPRVNRALCKHFIFIAYNKTRKAMTYSALMAWPEELDSYGQFPDDLLQLISKAYVIYVSENYPQHWSRTDEVEWVVDDIQDLFDGATWTTS